MSAAPAGSSLRLAIIGSQGFTHVGDSLRTAALAAGHDVTFFDVGEAYRGSGLARALAWRASHRPVALERFSARVADALVEARPDLVITTGAGGLSRRALDRLAAGGVVTANYSTDDPWNPAMSARWHLQALPAYRHVFTPRRANLEDFRRAGCADVAYLPFGYDPRHAAPPSPGAPAAAAHEVLFVGGADRDRVGFLREMASGGVAATVVGLYWERYGDLKARSLGVRTPEQLRALTAAASVNLCLVRRANRDGHVMRSLEIAAIGGCMLAEDTAEHRELFGPEGEAVLYFASPAGAAEKARRLIADADLRRRLAGALHARIVAGDHTYRDRLEAMIAAVRDARPVAA